MRLPENYVFALPKEYRGHPHFWERAMSRRQFIGASAAAGGAVLSAPLWAPALVEASGAVDPKVIPQFVTVFGHDFHFQFLTATTEPSTITDFRGVVGGVDLWGTGLRTDAASGEQTEFFTAVDNRFMTGTYVGVDGQRHRGTFGFV